MARARLQLFTSLVGSLAPWDEPGCADCHAAGVVRGTHKHNSALNLTPSMQSLLWVESRPPLQRPTALTT